MRLPASTIGLLLLAATAFCIREILVLPDGAAHVHVFDIGQGSAALLVTPSGNTVLVDGGPDTLTLSRMAGMLSFFRRTIDLLIISHADIDHIGGIPAILKRYRVGQVLMNGEVRLNPAYEAIIRELNDANIPVLLPDPSTDIRFDDGVTLDIVWPNGPAYATSETGNNVSVVMRIVCVEDSLLLPGDVETASETAIIASGRDVRSSVVVAPHHGSHTSSSSGFLLATSPSFIAISAGANNQYGHPHVDILDRYRFFGIRNKVTAEAGTLSFTLCDS